MGILTEISNEISSSMRQFNDDLIYGFRKRRISCIPQYLDSSFRQMVAFFNNQLKYVGYRTLTPEERLDYAFDNMIRKGYVSIRRTDTSNVRFEFEFNGDPYYIYIEVPYLRNECVMFNDTEYYPLFPIVERGGVNVTDSHTVIIKVMRIPITFGRRPSDKVQLSAVSGRQYWDLLLTVKIYQGEVGKSGERIPLILYNLCRLGFIKAMEMYGVKPKEISVVPEANDEDEDFEYFMLPNGLYLKADRDRLSDDMFFRRVVVSLFVTFITNTVFTPADVLGNETEYYCTTLGKMIGSKNRQAPMNALILRNAITHLDMTDLMLDSVAIKKLSSVGIIVNDIYDLLKYMFFNIDDMIVSYNPINLYDKMIGSLDQLMAGVIRRIVNNQYNVINSKRGINMTPEVFKTFCKKASRNASWISTAPVFRPKPTVYNSNFLMSVGAKRFLSLDSIESQGRGGKRKSTKTPPHLLESHPSQIVVTSLLDIPSSNPVATGSITPYLKVDEEGNIIKPPYAKELEHVFD